MKFGEKLKIERKRKRLTALELAKKCGVARSYISLIEGGKRMPAQHLILTLAEALSLKNHMVVNWYLEDLREKME